MIEVWAEEGVSPEHAFFILLFLCCCLYDAGYLRKKSKQECWRHKKQLMYILGVTQKGGNDVEISGDHAGEACIFREALIYLVFF